VDKMASGQNDMALLDEMLMKTCDKLIKQIC
jgi:hypothetical protein